MPIELLMFVREASGSVPPRPDDRMRDDELPYVAMIAGTLEGGFRTATIRQMIRAQSDGLRRIAETEAITWQSDVIQPAMQRGMRADEALGIEFGDRMAVLTEQAVIAMYHLQQARAWSAGIIDGVEQQLAAAGLHRRLEHPPAMCFLDITGYTRLTQERGDAAAAQLAEELGGIVRQTAVHHGGQPVKWLGDGVMLHFREPAGVVASALAMVRRVPEAGLPPAHVGVAAGPVVVQGGDYFGRTVNLASRVAAHARGGQVLVTDAVAAVAAPDGVAYRDLGELQLKGFTAPVRVLEARPARPQPQARLR
ncbi:MAG TPA: adenylate/guanylate cyclase domain-containing protein [Actinomycetota bacterium]|nr:adenylate/guanylate cyclase domain-containing protein [Actinomycetota bacterium]